MKTNSRVAVVGSGISGLSAAYILSQRHDVHLFEAAPRLGGHANTVLAGPEKTPVDTGFIVFNELNYPHLTALFRHLDVPVVDSEMTLSVRFQRPNLEWGGTNLRTLIAQKRNLVRPAFWSMVRDIVRFHQEADANLDRARRGGWTLRSLLAERRYGRHFVNWYLVPMGAAIWSTPPETMLEFPAETFLQFCLNHRLLQVNDRPMWRTVRGGSIEYVKRLAAGLRHVHLGSPVTAVARSAAGLTLKSLGHSYEFDKVVFATHPPQTCRILQEMDADEARVLSSFSYQKNVAHLHEDESYLPRRRALWSAWNFHQATDARSVQPVSLSYWMNRLQPLATTRNMIVTLNSDRAPGALLHTEEYEHPLFNTRAIEAQSQLEKIQGRGGVYHCGAWTRYGFHEDGILSAARLAPLWGLELPWQPKSAVATELTA